MMQTRQDDPQKTVDGRFVQDNGIDMYRITNFDQMPPFLMSIVSDSDHWMYVSSSGGLAAGRVQSERSLFPYETDDRLYRAGGSTGPFTLLRVGQAEGDFVLWEPFARRVGRAPITRNLYKSLVGDTVVLEETHDDLGMTFRYTWSVSSTYGFVRTSTLSQKGTTSKVRVELLDGLLNIMPANVPPGLQQSSSTLVEAYRRNEVDSVTGMGIFSLESRITDLPEPAESLHANIAWSIGLPDCKVVLSPDQIERFRSGKTVHPDNLTTGERAAYLVNATIELGAGTARSWSIVADVHQSQLTVQRRRAQLINNPNLFDDVITDVDRGSKRLRGLIATADGGQCTQDQMATAHHFANTLFNCMRGGVFVDSNSISIDDLLQFLEQRNRAVNRTHATWLASLGDRIDRRELLSLALEQGDPDLERLCLEYLPLTFSRRHGDPSRPWNRFHVRASNDDGDQILDYEGNWRDIFQNWEALCHSFPDYLESVVAKFVNASTVDGFNPYRVARVGIDWEVPDPEDPWSNIGYWGDHQIVYLLRLLEALSAFDPSALPRMLNREIFSYADVPYRLRPYAEILRDSKSTIEFDHERAGELDERAAIAGSDGRLVTNANGGVLHVSLAEKLLVPALTKLANLIVDGGIWMNTQRPEWNDANNALVGYGASIVTLAYLHRYLGFCERLFAALPDREFIVSVEVASWINQTLNTLTTYRDRLEREKISKRLLDALGTAFSGYRTTVYSSGFSGKTTVPAAAVADLCRVAREYADHSIRANRQATGLYHSYNLVHIADEGREVLVDHLPEMLEGQIAAISSGALSSDEVLAIVDALYTSELYRPDQNSFMLYPARKLAGFLAKNTIAAADVEGNPLLSALLEAGDTTLVEKDAFDTCRFAPSVATRANLLEALDSLSTEPPWTEVVTAHRSTVEDLFENVFGHKRFTGRSGSMYKYEGLGSIYWHMVSKLLLAVQEAFWEARDNGEPPATTESLARAYYRVRAGLSSDKTPQQYGAFPMDPYSHTPGHMGAQQPGMTGQVKEEILTRWGELGLRVADGTLSFDPCLVRSREFLQEKRRWSFDGIEGARQTIMLAPQSLGFTYCQVPVVYKLGANDAQIVVHNAEGGITQIAGASLDEETSQEIFRRSAAVSRIEVDVPRSALILP